MKWAVVYNYTGYEHCQSGTAPVLEVVKDQVLTETTLCRSSDDIRDPSGVRVWIGNVSVSESRGENRIIVTVSTEDSPRLDAGLKVTTPLEAWHEKTLLLGLSVHRDSEDCEEASCVVDRQLYLASMQYDGHVDWGTDVWAGAQLNLRMLRFANVYTRTPERTLPDVFAAIGGASGILLLSLGLLRKALEVLQVKGRGGRREVAASVAVAGVAALGAGAAEEISGDLAIVTTAAVAAQEAYGQSLMEAEEAGDGAPP